jgi:protein-tyrosine-phosphatase
MKVLFVCKGNVGRSQMAAALFNKMSKIKASSAGTNVKEDEAQKIKEIPLAKPVIESMKKEGIDVSENTRTQVTPEMLKNFDKVIVMAEPDSVPEYLSKSNKVEFWNIENPKGMDEKGYEKIISQLKSNIKSLS